MPSGIAWRRLAPGRALAANGLDRILDFSDAVANAALIGLQFLFAGTARADAAAEPGKFDALAGEARHQVVELGKLDLEMSFASARTPRKNIQDELGAVNNPAFRDALDIAELNRGKIVIHYDERRTAHLRLDFYFLELAAAHQSGGIQRFTGLQQRSDDHGPIAGGQFLEFAQGFHGAPVGMRVGDAGVPANVHAEQKHAFAMIEGLGYFHS